MPTTNFCNSENDEHTWRIVQTPPTGPKTTVTEWHPFLGKPNNDHQPGLLSLGAASTRTPSPLPSRPPTAMAYPQPVEPGHPFVAKPCLPRPGTDHGRRLLVTPPLLSQDVSAGRLTPKREVPCRAASATLPRKRIVSAAPEVPSAAEPPNWWKGFGCPQAVTR
jgi:hypothetical protein